MTEALLEEGREEDLEEGREDGREEDLEEGFDEDLDDDGRDEGLEFDCNPFCPLDVLREIFEDFPTLFFKVFDFIEDDLDLLEVESAPKDSLDAFADEEGIKDVETGSDASPEEEIMR